MESFFLKLGSSWTVSKVLPYIIFVILGLILYLILINRVRRKWSKLWLSVAIFAPVSVYFALNPIYSGDFSNRYREVQVSDSVDVANNALTVIAIPNCPYCAQSMETLRSLARRTNVDTIFFRVLTVDSTLLENYNAIAGSKVKVSNEVNIKEYIVLSKGRFPTFVYNDNLTMRIWSNEGFGARAIDWVEGKLTEG